MKKLIAPALLIAAIACVAANLHAADAAKDNSAPAPKPETKVKQMPFRGKVGAVDATAKTITLEGKETGRVFQVTSATKISKDGKPAVLADVTLGEAVGGLAKENAAGKWEIVTLRIGARPGKEKPSEKK